MSLMAVLRSAQDLDELHVAWSALTERMDLAQKNFKKYQSEYGAVKKRTYYCPLFPLIRKSIAYSRGKAPRPYPMFATLWTTSLTTVNNGRKGTTNTLSSYRESCVLRNIWSEHFLCGIQRRGHLRSTILQMEPDRK